MTRYICSYVLIFWGNFRGTDTRGFPIILLFLVSLHSDLALGIGCFFFFFNLPYSLKRQRDVAAQSKGEASLLMMLFI